MVNRLKEIRIQKGLTQQILADAMNFPNKNYVSRYENGVVGLSEELIFKFCEVLNTDPNSLFGFNNHNHIELNEEILETAIKLVEQNNSALTVNNKAKAISALYEMGCDRLPEKLNQNDLKPILRLIEGGRK